jgi:hypothetical protein
MFLNGPKRQNFPLQLLLFRLMALRSFQTVPVVITFYADC